MYWEYDQTRYCAHPTLFRGAVGWGAMYFKKMEWTALFQNIQYIPKHLQLVMDFGDPTVSFLRDWWSTWFAALVPRCQWLACSIVVLVFCLLQHSWWSSDQYSDFSTGHTCLEWIKLELKPFKSSQSHKKFETLVWKPFYAKKKQTMLLCSERWLKWVNMWISVNASKGSHHLKKTRILRKTFPSGGGESVRFLTLIQKWPKVVQNGPNGPKMSQITWISKGPHFTEATL